ncbi:MAG TPA: TAXI family TRAP transporter solute-binding subunit [Alphaproteobacteria bacterium]|nr:TAXI family TRAP transporter solute-binding subunit [Alphaproteobacteria bacterium]
MAGPTLRRRDFLRAAALAAAAGAAAGAVRPAAAATLLRIGTGGAGGSYYPLGRLLAEALTGTAEGGCDPGRCGLPGTVAAAQLSNGSVSNLEALREGRIDIAFAQADTVYWAWSGTGGFAGRPPYAGLRVVANLYTEALHVVVRRGAGIGRVADLAGRRVSLDEPGSGTLIGARAVLAAHGLGEADLKPEYIKPDMAMARIREDRLDAFFITVGAPSPMIAEAAGRGEVVLLPVEGAPAAALLRGSPFFAAAVLAEGLYPGLAAVPTVGVRAQLVADAAAPDDLVHGIAAVLWGERAAGLLGRHPKGGEIRRDRAAADLAVPLHEGAARYYRGVGLLP